LSLNEADELTLPEYGNTIGYEDVAVMIRVVIAYPERNTVKEEILVFIENRFGPILADLRVKPSYDTRYGAVRDGCVEELYYRFSDSTGGDACQEDALNKILDDILVPFIAPEDLGAECAIPQARHSYIIDRSELGNKASWI
jgi:hypothetical protein